MCGVVRGITTVAEIGTLLPRGQGLIERVDIQGGEDGHDLHPGRPRKAYRLSPLGLRVLQA